MENFGCVVVKELYMLTNLDYGSLSSLEYAAELIVHEMSHMWHGNLVTMDWWDCIWLNESFARLMEETVVAQLCKEMHISERVNVDVVKRAMDFDDNVKKTHPLEIAREKIALVLSLLLTGER